MFYCERLLYHIFWKKISQYLRKKINVFQGDSVFVPNDVTASDILKNGHMDKVVRLAIQCGVDPITAIQMGSLNSPEDYRIDHLVGSIAPGKIADIVFVDDLQQFTIQSVIAQGVLCHTQDRIV